MKKSNKTIRSSGLDGQIVHFPTSCFDPCANSLGFPIVSLVGSYGCCPPRSPGLGCKKGPCTPAPTSHPSPQSPPALNCLAWPSRAPPKAMRHGSWMPLLSAESARRLRCHEAHKHHSISTGHQQCTGPQRILTLHFLVWSAGCIQNTWPAWLSPEAPRLRAEITYGLETTSEMHCQNRPIYSTPSSASTCYGKLPQQLAGTERSITHRGETAKSNMSHLDILIGKTFFFSNCQMGLNFTSEPRKFLKDVSEGCPYG